MNQFTSSLEHYIKFLTTAIAEQEITNRLQIQVDADERLRNEITPRLQRVLEKEDAEAARQKLILDLEAQQKLISLQCQISDDNTKREIMGPAEMAKVKIRAAELLDTTQRYIIRLAHNRDEGILCAKHDHELKIQQYKNDYELKKKRVASKIKLMDEIERKKLVRNNLHTKHKKNCCNT